ncbi:biotin-dependent carboxyltransferase family protein [Polaromonas jejuensis]|uniref:Biotin-dependent carboxyltransferase family protein n=1 Tax=Polaromonas jejuensis TaxID=457502 RepID=A0ABW0Q978_9BURK|nr:biotin-dependent carboxyltransferase family protein [Polaromonas jejuensis]
MSAQLEVVESGLAVAVQDRGRFGYRRLGVPVSGALDPSLLAAANALLGNAADAAALEILLTGPALKVRAGRVRLSLAGEIGAKLQTAQGKLLPVEPWCTVTLGPGDTIRFGAVAAPKAGGPGIAYVGISGGVEVPAMLASRSTYARAALGGVHGRAIAVGDLLPCRGIAGDTLLEFRGPGPLVYAGGPIRVVPGPQADHFSDEALQAFFSQPFTVTRDSDRMGMRLEGPALRHSALGADIASDGVTPGAIQVPANGQPIILMADCQTVGGYPKIATVIRADLPRLAHARPGAQLRFQRVSLAEAAAARAAQAQQLALWVSRIASFRPPGVIDEAVLYGGNLVSGMIRADA